MVTAIQTFNLLTIEDLARYPDDGMRREIVQGELSVTLAPTPIHQLVVVDLVLRLGNFVQDHRLGRVLTSPVDIRLFANDVVEPDIVFIPAEREALLLGKFIDGLPELVVEVLSPSTRAMDLVHKRALYARAGINEYWIVDPENQTVLIHQLDGGIYSPIFDDKGNPKSHVLEGLEIDVAELFKGIPH
jgi:Uma2 family endonuclease